MAVDRRKKNLNWSIANEQGNTYNSITQGRDGATVAVLMDIRDELQALNAVFRCSNFIGLPRVLKQVRDNTKPRPPHRRLPRNIPALELAAKLADQTLEAATLERERVVSALADAYRRAR